MKRTMWVLCEAFTLTWAYGKTAVRQLSAAPSRILEIVDITRRGRFA